MMIYTVTLNPSIDYVVEVTDLKLGELNRMNRDLKLPGGKGINVSRILKRLGVENTALGFLGGFTGLHIDNLLREEGVSTDFVPVSGETRINIKLKHGAETEINGLGPEIGRDQADALLEKIARLQSKDILVLSGSVPSSLGGDYYERLIHVCKRAGAEFVIDTTGAALLGALKYRPLLIKPNHHELAELFGVTMDSREQVIFYGRKLLDQGARRVLVSMAGEGAIFIEQEAVYYANAPEGGVRNSVGAGDSMIAGFIATLALGGDLPQAFRTGAASGSATAFTDDLATADQIRKLLSQIHITRLM